MSDQPDKVETPPAATAVAPPADTGPDDRLLQSGINANGGFMDMEPDEKTEINTAPRPPATETRVIIEVK